MRAEVEKINLRKELLDRRRKIFDKAKKDSVIFEKLIALPEFAKAELILTYVSTELEVDTRRLINYCFEKNIPAALPVIIDEKMKFFHLMKLWEIEKEVIDFTRSICV
ncbi:MAG: hypothetical protein FWG33_05125, partial [Oscillospiraceae bacterium]|nr:hypothetical protein [Oscillospiraceae bacterium]